MENQNEPKLEDYGLNISLYKEYKKKIADLYSIKKSQEFPFWKFIFIISLPFSLVFFLIFKILWLPILIFLFSFLLYDNVKEFFDKNNEKLQNTIKEIKSCKDRDSVESFEEEASAYFSKQVDDFYKYRVYRKRWDSGREEGTYREMLSEVSKIWQIFYGCKYPRAYYLLKKEKDRLFFPHEHSINRFNFSNIYGIKTKEKDELKEITETPKTDLTKKVVDAIIKDSESYNIKNKIDTNSYILDPNKKIKEEFWKKRDEKINETNKSNFKDKEFITREQPKTEESFNKKENIIIEEPKKKGFWASIMEDVNEEIDRSNNPTSGINKTEEKENIIDINPPETKYRVSRKIDWDSINQTKKITGLKGEEIVLEMEKSYLNSIGMKELSGKVRHVSKEIGDGLGYDILSYFADGQEKYIEVKSSNKANNNSFYLSQNELDFMKNNKYNSVIYRIFNINENEEIPTLRVHRADDILGYKQIIPSQYIVKMD